MESGLEGVSERWLLLHNALHDAVTRMAVMMVMMLWAGFGGRKRQGDDRSADERRA
ncbi:MULTISPECIES: hypothetical protein [Bradyrhizobium]|uniref:Uncharacterized protein n=1 Tax=Bradyrhizobium elkanii TaxID=29448 RepID=A0A8I2C867_BRAEL|nr:MULTISPECIES: hypothetical protein [Bradyrhizobium]MBP1297157.1 hypothetical protein [Bradyrhizobium elkanii]MCP1932080.1 hypothetical protein [Bradyrhizobium elkanii]MCS3577377.1 hypothetical protein [Bradyrhizobium elkanii]MCS3720253.1 hypothetical protein [Bradyrhizobium elkanii]MCS4004670.1 hypothetical protein [Bradyrhizobium elkanii USDA 61]